MDGIVSILDFRLYKFCEIHSNNVNVLIQFMYFNNSQFFLTSNISVIWYYHVSVEQPEVVHEDKSVTLYPWHGDYVIIFC